MIYSVATAALLSAAALAGCSAAEPLCDDSKTSISCGIRYGDEASCEAAGCCWRNDGVQCYAPVVYGHTYKQTKDEAGHFGGSLTLIKPSGIFGASDFAKLDLEVTQETNGRTHIVISPEEQSNRWKVPESLLPRPGGLYTGGAMIPGGFYTEASVTSSTSFNLIVTRKQGGVNPIYYDTIFELTNSLVYQDQYLQFTLSSPGEVLATYGFGESTRSVQNIEEGKTYTLWASDFGSSNFDKSLYGSHPLIVQVLPSGKANGVLFLNSNAIELTMLKDATSGKWNMNIQSTGGTLELYVFGGPTPEEVVRQYQEVVGFPAMMPYWSLGFHNCRWGYSSVAELQEVVEGYKNAGIPLQTQWADIDYMDNYLDFTLDPVNFKQADMKAFTDMLHKNDQNFVPIVDPGIYADGKDYPALVRGQKQNVFVENMDMSGPYLGQVWPGPTYFPDWFAENATSWWTTEFKEFKDLVDYDGIWIDMNEAANFCNGDGRAQVCANTAESGCPADGEEQTKCCLVCTTINETYSYDFPPFIPHVSQGSLGGKTLSMGSLHAGGIIEYDAHNLYGFMESIATNKALSAIMPTKRPFVLSRSTFSGSGKYTAHWTGDNAATWQDLAASIVTMNNFALFGMPMVGADICGFGRDTTEKLCNRWIQVGAFSPFSRNHNDKQSSSQELYRWPSVAESSRVVLNLRYRLLPHLYTLMFWAHKVGRTVHNAMWMHFPNDPEAHRRHGQYMWGGSVLFTPVLTEDSTSVKGYFPYGRWFSLTDRTYIDATGGATVDEGVEVLLDTPLNKTNVHLRGGHIIPMQNAGMTVKEVHSSPFTLVVAVSKFGAARGTLFFDDGDQPQLESVTLVEYELSGDVLEAKVINSSYVLPSAKVTTIEYLGVSASSCSASMQVSGKSVVPTVTLNFVEPYIKVTLTLSADAAPNVATPFSVTLTCVEPGGSEESDHNNFFDELPVYGQAFFVLGIMAAVALMVLGVRYAFAQHESQGSAKYQILEENAA